MLFIMQAIIVVGCVALALSIAALIAVADWNFRGANKMHEVYQPRHRMPAQPRPRSVVLMLWLAFFQALIMSLEGTVKLLEKRWNYRFFYALQYAGNEGWM